MGEGRQAGCSWLLQVISDNEISPAGGQGLWMGQGIKQVMEELLLQSSGVCQPQTWIHTWNYRIPACFGLEGPPSATLPWTGTPSPVAGCSKLCPASLGHCQGWDPPVLWAPCAGVL